RVVYRRDLQKLCVTPHIDAVNRKKIPLRAALLSTLRELRAQTAELSFEVVNALEQGHDQRDAMRLEIETHAQAAGGADGQQALAVEYPWRRFRIDRRDCTVIDKLAHFRFRDACKLGELRQRELGVLGQPHRFGMF